MSSYNGPVFTVEYKIKTNRKDVNYLNKVFRLSNKIRNCMVSHCNKRIRRLRADIRYRAALSDYHGTDTAVRKKAAARLKDLVREYGLTKDSLEKFGKVQQYKYADYLDAQTVQKIAKDVITAVDKVLYSKGKRLHYKKLDDLLSLEGKTNRQGIRFKNGRLVWGDHTWDVQFPKRNDSRRWYHDAIAGYQVSFVRIKRRAFAGGWQYYMELVLRGRSPKIRPIGKGTVGHDIGTGSIASVGKDRASLKTLAYRVKDYDGRISDILTRMDVSRTASNPGNYNTDGTVRRGRKRWKYTRHYRRLQFRLKELYRKRREDLSQSHDILANELIRLGDVHYIEKMNFSALQKRANGYHKTGRTILVEDASGHTKEVAKMSSRSRFGKSLKNHAPALLQAKMKYRLEKEGGSLIPVRTAVFKASQTDHTTGKAEKHGLSERAKMIGGQLVQRDLYSAFLLRHALPGLDGPDLEGCRKDFDDFLRLQDACIRRILNDPDDDNPTYGLSGVRTMSQKGLTA